MQLTALQPKVWWQNYYFKAFVYGVGISFLFFIPFIIYDKGYFLFYGDFNVQQVPFYQMAHDAVRSGSFGWSWTTDLGANFIGSYSFYLLGSPFFWLTIPFPSAAVPYLMGPLLILKFGCASLTGYVYLKRYVQNQNFAVIGGMLYAFSGFSVYNIFFNHFHEAIVFFPLMLAALDEYMYQRRRGIFALTVFACCFVNYYFFVGQVVFCLIYFAIRLIMKSWKISVRDFFLLLLEGILGVATSCVLLIPTILTIIQNPRVDNPPNGWNALLYSYNQRYVHILQSLFFPPDIPARPNFTPNSESKWASLGAWLPLFSMTGVIGFMQRKKKHWLKVTLGVLFLMAMVPILNSAFQLFNSSYYARWFYILTLMMSLATISCLEFSDINWKRAIRWTLLITLGIAIPIGLMPNTTTKDGVTTTTYGLESYPTRFWTYVAIAVVSLLLLIIILKYRNKSRVWFARLLNIGVCVITVVYATYFIALGKTQSYDTHNQIIPTSLNGGKDLNLPESDFARSDFYKSMDNQAMFWQVPSIQAFHSIVPGSIMEFYPTIGVTRDVGSRPDVKYYGLRALTSCRWLFDYTGDNDNFVKEDGTTRMPGWTYYDTQNGYDVWENQYYIPMGFSYDYYYTEEQYNQLYEDNRNLLLLKAIVLDEEQATKYQDILEPAVGNTSFSYTEEAYYKDCLERQSMACSDFTYDSYGFTAHYTSDKERLVFFSVPYESGWTATVNGEPVDIENVNIGFMAVKVPAGTSEIQFHYQTPGLKLGAIVTGCAVPLLVAYVLIMKKVDSSKITDAKHRITYKTKEPLPEKTRFKRTNRMRRKEKTEE